MNPFDLPREDLLPELQDAISPHKAFGFCLSHPLVQAVPYLSPMNAYYNRGLQQKQQVVDEALRSKNWGTVLAMYERPYRFSAFSQIAEFMTDGEYFDNLSWVWTDSENIWQVPNLRELLTARDRGAFPQLTDCQEFVDGLPDQITVYRGHQKHNSVGFSWTLSYHRARWFADRYQSKPGVVSIVTVNKTQILGCLEGRGEHEIILDPATVSPVKMTALRRTPSLKKVLDDCKEHFDAGPLHKNSGHGLRHWDKVERNAIHLAMQTRGADVVVCRLFAMIHDCCRENEMSDPEHGPRAAAWAETKLPEWDLCLTKEQIKNLLTAIRIHNGSKPVNNPTVGCCLDADRLDLLRVGIHTDRKQLSTKAGKASIWNI